MGFIIQNSRSASVTTVTIIIIKAYSNKRSCLKINFSINLVYRIFKDTTINRHINTINIMFVINNHPAIIYRKH